MEKKPEQPAEKREKRPPPPPREEPAEAGADETSLHPESSRPEQSRERGLDGDVYGR